MTCSCSGQCRKPPYTCSAQVEPDFLTQEQRDQYQGPWSAPFEPWVVRSWAKHLDEIGGFETAHRFRQGLLDGIAIANDPTLSHTQKVAKLLKKRSP